MFEKIKELSKYFLPFLIAVFLYSFITDYSSTMQLLNGVFGFIGFALSRFVLGFVLAYMLNFLSSWLEKRFRFPRWLSILSAYLLFFGAIVWMILYIIPLMYDSVQQIFVALPQYYGSIQDFVNRFFFTFSEDGRQVINDFITKASDSMLKALTGFLEFASIKSFVLSSTRIIINIIFGLMISVYGLIEKDSLLLACKRLLYSFVKKPRADAFVSFLSEANRIFSQFIVGKLLSSLIVGIISFVLYAAFGLRFSAFFAIIAAVFNLIPYFGPWIGGAITIVVLLCISPLHAVYALFIMLAVQTIDNFFISPKVLGGMVGISPLLTIVAITLGGDIGGFFGMFFGIPALAALKLLIVDPVVERRLKNRDIRIE